MSRSPKDRVAQIVVEQPGVLKEDKFGEEASFMTTGGKTALDTSSGNGLRRRVRDRDPDDAPETDPRLRRCVKFSGARSSVSFA